MDLFRYSEESIALEMNDMTYDELERRAIALLDNGKRVIVDASFREDRRRKQLIQSCGIDKGVRSGFLQLTCAPEETRCRLEQRVSSGHDASDADWNVYVHAASLWEEPSSIVRRRHQTIQSDGTMAETFDQAMKQLQQFHMI